MCRFIEKSSTQIAFIIFNILIYTTSTGEWQHLAVVAISCGFFCLGTNHGKKMKEIEIEREFKYNPEDKKLK